MKIYVAAPFYHSAQAATLANQLEALGHEITHRWWDVEGDDESAPLELRRIHAEDDVAGVLKAELLILLNSGPSGGKMFEAGVAFIATIPIWLVGERTSVFHYLDRVEQFPTVADLLSRLTTESQLVR